jgi:hypothetical protein
MIIFSVDRKKREGTIADHFKDAEVSHGVAIFVPIFCAAGSEEIANLKKIKI